MDNNSYILVVILLILIICYSFYNTSCFFATCIVRFLHLLVIVFVIIGPFICSSKMNLLFYISMIVFIMIHWVLMNDTCFLTLMEQFFTGRKSEETFIGKIVKPVYNVTSREINNITIMLLLFAISKYIYLCCK
jgi:hypothetical protein